ncbi:IS21 family transposase [Thermovenabulum gondwanense]|nr:IS21 family transposase [Thermovenabulum gondwanense]
MTQINDIRHSFFFKGENISEIAREFKKDRKTVRKYIYQEDWNMKLKAKEIENAFPKLNPFKADIDQWLEEDKKARKKQRHTAKRIYDRLCEKYKDNFNCSYRTVAAYVASKKKEIYQDNSCCLPLEHIPGEAQVDFGEADFYENGILYHGFYLNVSFPYSNAGFTQLFKGENRECLFQGLKNIFEYIGGVPPILWFDDPSTLVAAILKDGERKLTDAFLRFKEHYGFEAVFCNPAAGHEKGNVENKVGYHRRNFLVPVPKFEKLEDFNRELLQLCEQDMYREHYRKDGTHAEIFNEDKKALLKLPDIPYEVADYITVKTNAYAKFSLNGGKHIYSTAPKYANSRILVKITANEVIPLDESHREIVRHRRLYGDSKQESMDWLPYLTQLSRCPGALKYSGIYNMLPDPLREYLEGCSKSERGKALKILASLCIESSFEKALSAVTQAILYGVKDLDSLIAIHSRITGITPQLELVRLPEEIPELKAFSFNAEEYDKAFLKGGANIYAKG